MTKTYKLKAESAGLNTTFSVYKNEHRILYLVSKEKAIKYIKKQKEFDKEHKILNKNFEINSIWREDLIEYIGKKQALKLTNEEMKNIAKLMGEYMQEDYWSCLTEALNKLKTI